jgi:hypothetical protein
MKYHVGLDVTLKDTAICVIATDAGSCAEGKAATEAEAIAAFLSATG